MGKTTRVLLPETFWLALESVDVCKHFSGEPAVVRFKSDQPDTSPLEAAALEIEDRY
jgi:hypothetical protein